MEPKDILKKLHPNQFSDSKIVEKVDCPRELLDFKIFCLFEENMQFDFEGLVRKLMEREVCPNLIEETGYIVDQMQEEAGAIIQRNPNQFDSTGIFQMTSYYYFCNVKPNKTKQHLDKYEQDQEFMPVWMDIDEVIAKNEALLTQKNTHINPWVYRETIALRRIKESGLMVGE